MTLVRERAVVTSPAGVRRRRRLILPGIAAAWLAVVVFHLLLSGRTWLWAVPAAAPPFVFLAVPVALLVTAALVRADRWRVAALAVAALAIGFGQSGVNPAALWRHEPPAPPGALRVVSWNTEYWDQTDDPAAFYHRLRAENADVYLLQEYMYYVGSQPIRIDDTQRLRAEFPGYYIAASSELVTLSRFPVVAQRPIDTAPWVSAARHNLPPPGAAFPSFWMVKALRTDVRVGDRTVSFYNVHIPLPFGLDTSPLSATFYQKLRAQDGRRAAAYQSIEADLSTNKYPVVMAGDFNSGADAGSLRQLADRLVTATPDSLYPVSWRFRMPGLWRLDWVFTTRDVHVYDYRFVDPAGMSDHALQRLRVAIPHA